MTQTEPVWATDTFGLAVRHDAGVARVTDLVLPGLRRNPRRAHLLVSTVLGKHLAVAPQTVIAAGHRLGAEVARRGLGAVDVVGMAETATALGHCVADALGAPLYLHTTRRVATPDEIYAEFQESHSHATDHAMQPSSHDLFSAARPLVLVDDEISTGKTALATIAALQQLLPRPSYVVASLVDVRSEAQRAAVDDAARAMGTQVHFVSLAQGTVHQPAGLIESVCALDPPVLNPAAGGVVGVRRDVALGWPADVPEGGRYGFLHSDLPQFDRAVHAAASQIGELLDAGRPVLVIGHEELMYLPLRIADALSGSGFQTRFQSTSRSPAYVVDAAGYPLRAGWTFPACESGESAPRFLYNGWPAPAGDRPTQLVLVVDHIAASGNLDVANVLATAGYDVLVAQVHGPSRAALAQSRGNRG